MFRLGTARNQIEKHRLLRNRLIAGSEADRVCDQRLADTGNVDERSNRVRLFAVHNFCRAKYWLMPHVLSGRRSS